MSEQTHEVPFLALPGGRMIRAKDDHVLVVTIAQRRAVPESPGPVGKRGAPRKPGR